MKEVLEYLKTKGFEVTYVPVDEEGLITVKVSRMGEEDRGPRRCEGVKAEGEGEGRRGIKEGD